MSLLTTWGSGVLKDESSSILGSQVVLLSVRLQNQSVVTFGAVSEVSVVSAHTPLHDSFS